MSPLKMPGWLYQQFDADFAKDVPAEGYGGWKKAELPFDRERSALIVMHAWDCGTREQFPGWHRAVEYIPRSYDICERVFPDLLASARGSGLKVFHVVRPNSAYYRELPGYKRAAALAGGEELERVSRASRDPVFDQLQRIRFENAFPGPHNQPDITAGQAKLDFPAQARPLDSEGVAESSIQLHALCSEEGINHLVYAGFAINGCLLTSPGGMVDMQRRGYICSAIRQAVTAIECKETAREQTAKEIALWQVALLYGFVYDADDFIRVLSSTGGD